MGDLWVFGYGSLMWRPDFAHVETRAARLSGYHRALCVHSHVHRGTPERPGLVLGLDRGGACRGLAFRIPADAVEDSLSYLRARELVTHVYREKQVRLVLDDASTIEALTYTVYRGHVQYAGALDAAEAAAIVRGATGQSGPNPDYVFNTVAHLRDMGIRDRKLEAVVARLQD